MNKTRLFCIPHAGSTAMVYNKWNALLEDYINLAPLELSGRGRRFGTTLYEDIFKHVNDIYSTIKEMVDSEPYAIFGHSMGGLIAYELYHKLINEGHNEPLHLFVSGKSPPNVKEDDKLMHILPEEQFIKEILKVGGTPEELFQDRQLKDIFLPLLRADYKAIETYEFIEHDKKVSCAMTVLYGIHDFTLKGDINEWKRFAICDCSVKAFNGGHFFIDDNIEEIMQLIRERI